jgi:two-component system LytT family response regulator
MNKSELKILVIDSEPSSAKQTIGLLEQNPSISQIENAADASLALLSIIIVNPDIVFIEYPMKGEAGTELLKFIKTKYPEIFIVFISESKLHAVDAIRNGIFNYLLKPFSKLDIEKLIDKVQLSTKANNRIRIAQIIEQIPDATRIKLQTTKGYLMVNPDEVVYCKADGVYTELFLTNDRTELSYLFLSKVEEILKPFNFMKVSRSCIINMRYLRRIFRDNNAIILSVKGIEFEVKGSKQAVRILSKIEVE